MGGVISQCNDTLEQHEALLFFSDEIFREEKPPKKLPERKPPIRPKREAPPVKREPPPPPEPIQTVSCDTDAYISSDSSSSGTSSMLESSDPSEATTVHTWEDHSLENDRLPSSSTVDDDESLLNSPAKSPLKSPQDFLEEEGTSLPLKSPQDFVSEDGTWWYPSPTSTKSTSFIIIEPPPPPPKPLRIITAELPEVSFKGKLTPKSAESGKGEFFTFLEGDLEKRVKLVLSGLGSPLSHHEIQTSAKEASVISFKENLKIKDVQHREKEASPSHLKCENIQEEESTKQTFENIPTKTDFPEEQEFQNEHYVSSSSQSQSNCEKEEEEVQEDLSPKGNSTEGQQIKVHRAENGHAFDAGFPADPEPDDFFHSNPAEKPNSMEEPSTEAPKPASPQFNEFSFRSRSFEDSLLKSMSMTSSTNDLSEEEDTTPQFILKKRKKKKNVPPLPSSPSHAVPHDEYRQDLSEKNDLSEKREERELSPAMQKVQAAILEKSLLLEEEECNQIISNSIEKNNHNRNRNGQVHETEKTALRDLPTTSDRNASSSQVVKTSHRDIEEQPASALSPTRLRIQKALLHRSNPDIRKPRENSKVLSPTQQKIQILLEQKRRHSKNEVDNSIESSESNSPEKQEISQRFRRRRFLRQNI